MNICCGGTLKMTAMPVLLCYHIFYYTYLFYYVSLFVIFVSYTNSHVHHNYFLAPTAAAIRREAEVDGSVRPRQVSGPSPHRAVDAGLPLQWKCSRVEC